MTWFESLKEEAPNACVGTIFGIIRGCTGFNSFTEREVRDIQSAQELSEYTLSNSPLSIEDGVVFDEELINAILENQKGALVAFLDTVSGLTPEQKSLLAVIAAKQVCSLALRNKRFHTLLADACVNLLVV